MDSDGGASYWKRAGNKKLWGPEIEATQSCGILEVVVWFGD